MGRYVNVRCDRIAERLEGLLRVLERDRLTRTAGQSEHVGEHFAVQGK